MIRNHRRTGAIQPMRGGTTVCADKTRRVFRYICERDGRREADALLNKHRRASVVQTQVCLVCTAGVHATFMFVRGLYGQGNRRAL